MLRRFPERVSRRLADPAAPVQLVVAFGDSVTQGWMEKGLLDREHVYHQVLRRQMESSWPGSPCQVLNAGIGGETAGDGLKRLQRDVIAPAPDLVLVGFCLNDACRGAGQLDAFAANIAAILEGIRVGCGADIIVLTPNFMADREERALINPGDLGYAPTIIRTQRDGTLRAYAGTLRRVAGEAGVPVADVHAAWEALAAAGADTTALLSNGLNHPGPDGHRLAAETVLDTMRRCWPS